MVLVQATVLDSRPHNQKQAATELESIRCVGPATPSFPFVAIGEVPCIAGQDSRPSNRTVYVQLLRFKNPPRMVMTLRKFCCSSGVVVMPFLGSLQCDCSRPGRGMQASISLRICRPNNCMRTSLGSAWEARETYFPGCYMFSKTSNSLHVSCPCFSEALPYASCRPGRLASPK